MSIQVERLSWANLVALFGHLDSLNPSNDMTVGDLFVAMDSYGESADPSEHDAKHAAYLQSEQEPAHATP